MIRSVSVILIVMLVVSTPVFFRQLHRRIVGVKAGVVLEGRNMERYYRSEVRVIVEEMARQRQRAPVDASIDKESGQVIAERPGVFVDVDLTVYLLMQADANANLSLVLHTIVPPLRTEHLERLVDVLGVFSTGLMGSPSRVSNIRLSLAALNNTLLLPGQVFSFNEVVGERTRERGYKAAPIIVGETVIPGVGGGICQTSTTLYNAVRRAGLQVVERRIHSIAPSYIQHGMDATVAWPHTDFKFRNNLPDPVIVKGEVHGWKVRVWIVGMGQEEG